MIQIENKGPSFLIMVLMPVVFTISKIMQIIDFFSNILQILKVKYFFTNRPLGKLSRVSFKVPNKKSRLNSCWPSFFKRSLQKWEGSVLCSLIPRHSRCIDLLSWGYLFFGVIVGGHPWDDFGFWNQVSVPVFRTQKEESFQLSINKFVILATQSLKD